MGGPLLVVLALLLVAFFELCLALERRGREVVVVLIVLGVAVVDAALYPDTTASSATNIFHPQLLGQNLRLTQVVIPVALLARLLAGSLPRRVGLAVVSGLAFCAWVLVSAVSGLVQGHDPALVLRQATIVIHVGGGLALAAGVPAREYVHGRALPKFLQGCAVLAAVLFVTDAAGVRVSTHAIPFLPLTDVGSYAADAATLFSSLGVLGLVLSLVKPGPVRDRVHLTLPSVVLVLSHLASPQRAARVGLYVSVLIVVLAVCSPTGRRRLRWSVPQVLTATACVAALALGYVLVTTVSTAARAPQGGVAVSHGRGALEARTREGSIQSRFNQWAVAWADIEQRPLTGNGLGDEQTHFEVGQQEFRTSDITHNIVLDVLRRMGVVGLAFGAVAVLVLCAQAVGVWRRHPDDRVAALGMAAVAVVGGVLAKGMIESIFEKNRLAVLLGVVLGMALSATLAPRRGVPPVTDRAARPLPTA